MANQVQVAQWIEQHDGKWVDFDGAYGAQCMDLSVQYAHDLWGVRLVGNAEALRTQPLPAGWQRIRNSRGFVPKQGDIFVWYGAAHPYGHTGIIISANLSTYTCLEQNMVTGNGTAADKAAKHTRAYPADFWGVVRPPIAAGGNAVHAVAPVAGRTKQTGTFKANSIRSIRRSPKTSGNNPVAELPAGGVVKYDSIIDSDGWRWVSYVGNSGNRNYIAVRRLKDNYRAGLCY